MGMYGKVLLFCFEFIFESTYCRNPSDYDFDKSYDENKIPTLLYGYTNFDNIFAALFTVLHFTSPSVWSTINFIVNPLIFVKIVYSTGKQ